LIINVVRDTPFEDPSIQHLAFPDARRLIQATRSVVAVLTHFGMGMRRAKPWELARQLETELGVKALTTTDGLSLPLK